MNDYEQAIEYIKKVSKKDKNLETGFRELDQVVGYTPKGCLITIAGRPAMGKTTLLCNLALNMLKADKSILFITLNLSKELLIRKLMFLDSKIQPNKMGSDSLTADDYKKLKESIKFLSDKTLLIGENDVAEINIIEREIKQNKFDYIFIDTIQKMPQNYTEENGQSLVVNELKRIAKENNVTTILSSEVSIELEERIDRMPILTDLQGDGSLEKLSDVVIFIYRHNYYDFEETRFDNTKLFIAKNRLGPECFVDMHFNNEILTFEDLPIIDIF